MIHGGIVFMLSMSSQQAFFKASLIQRLNPIFQQTYRVQVD